MGSYAGELAAAVLGVYGTFTPDWYLALYYEGTDPIADSVSAEVSDSRIQVNTWTTGTPYATNWNTLYIGPLTACTVAGWFLVNGATATDVAWVGTFTTPVTLVTGDTLRFDPGSINVGFDAAIAVTYPPADPPVDPGGGGLPG